MRWYLYIPLGGLALALAGCGKDPTVKEIEAIRAEGQLQEAREKALDALQETPANMDLWREFARIATEQARASERNDGPNTINYLVEATLVCGGYYKFRNQKPNRDWRDACRLCAAEVTKQANKIQTTMGAQAESAEYLKRLLEMERGDSGQRGAKISAARMVDDYRANARTLLYQSVMIGRLLETLPEITPGVFTILQTQLESARQVWKQNLELLPDYTAPIEERANQAVDVAFNQVTGDLQTLGYIIPGTIIENGIVE